MNAHLHSLMPFEPSRKLSPTKVKPVTLVLRGELTRQSRALVVLFWVCATAVATVCVAQPPPLPVSPVVPTAPVKTAPAVTPPAIAPAAPLKPPAAVSVKPVPPAPTKPVPPAIGAPAKVGEKGKMTIQSLELITKDNVTLRAFYAASEKGKEAVPVIVLHEWKGQASPYSPLVKSLWDAGCAVIVPEFRGHGGSREYTLGGKKREFDLARMGKADVMNIINGDMEAVKKYLREENNEGKLNLNALALIGIREGAVIASHWAVKDLNFPSVGSKKQGQDVKALVLVSPEKMLEGVLLDDTLRDRFFWQLPFFLVVGRGSPQFADADRFYKRLETMKKKAGQGKAEGLVAEVVPTTLAGPALLNDAPGVLGNVTAFIKTELVDRSAKIPYVKRD